MAAEQALREIDEWWQALCAACCLEWKAQSEAMASYEATERKVNHGDHGE